jgi:hypothetical protein
MPLDDRLRRYALEIYMPESQGYDVACFIESDFPFLALHVGDIMNPRVWLPEAANLIESIPSQYGSVLRITGLEHFVIQTDNGYSQHKIGVFTERLDNIAESRQG